MKAIKLTIVTGIVVIIVLTCGLITILRQRQALRDSQIKIDSSERRSKQFAIEYGRRIFRDSCRMCHAGKGMRDNYLEDVVKNLGETYLNTYLTKQDSLINAKDKYAIETKHAYGNSPSSHNFKFTSQELEALIEYLK